MNSLRFKVSASLKAPTIEFDATVNAWYVRFKRAKIAKTLHEDGNGVVSAIDLDSKNEVIGVELIGVKEFTIKKLKDNPQMSRVDMSKVDFEKARFMPSSVRNTEAMVA